MNAAGDTFLGWGMYGLDGTYRSAGGSWTEPFTIRRDQDADVLEAIFAAVAPNGEAVVLWDQEEMPLELRVWTAKWSAAPGHGHARSPIPSQGPRATSCSETAPVSVTTISSPVCTPAL